jgi:hypothetical protein
MILCIALFAGCKSEQNSSIEDGLAVNGGDLIPAILYIFI